MNTLYCPPRPGNYRLLRGEHIEQHEGSSIVQSAPVPTVDDFSSKLSWSRVIVPAPVDSVMPKKMRQSAPIFSLTCSISTTGTGVPPVYICLRDERSNSPARKRGELSMAISIVGTQKE